MNKNNLKVGTRITFYPVDGAGYSAEGTIVKNIRSVTYGRLYSVRVDSGVGKGASWPCLPSDIISIEPKAGAWGAK